MDEPACRPDSVRALSRPGGHPSPEHRCRCPVAAYPQTRASSPRTSAQARRCRTLLALLRVGFTQPPQSPTALVVSYTTVSPLPAPVVATYVVRSDDRAAGGLSLWHCPAGHPGWVLPTTLLDGVRTFLGERVTPPDAAARPAHPRSRVALPIRTGPASGCVAAELTRARSARCAERGRRRRGAPAPCRREPAPHRLAPTPRQRARR